MIRWTVTLTVLLTLVGGTALMADAAEWTVIGDGYVPVETVREAPKMEPAPATDGFASPWLAIEDGYVWRTDTPAADEAPQLAESDCDHQICSLDTCETERIAGWTVVGDGYAPRASSGAPEMTCC